MPDVYFRCFGVGVSEQVGCVDDAGKVFVFWIHPLWFSGFQLMADMSSLWIYRQD